MNNLVTVDNPLFEAWGCQLPPDVVEALRTARRELQPLAERNVGFTPYAMTYLDHLALAMTEAVVMGWDEIDAAKTQILYMLSNTQAWRGPVAKATKATLKAFATQRR